MTLCELRIQRHKAFFATKKPGLLTTLSYKYGPEVPVKLPIDQIDWMDDSSVERFAESQYRQFEAINRQHDKAEDDYVPWMGIQVGTGSIGASYLKDAASVQMHYESITDWMDVPVNDWGDLNRIGFDPGNAYFRALFQVTRYLVNRFDGSFGIRNYPHFNALDLANQFRGNDLFTDIYDSPDEVREMLRLNNRAVADLEKYVQDNLIKPSGAFGAVCGVYVENGVYLSCDAGDMIGPDLLKEFGWAEMQELCNIFRGAFLHHHEMGMKTLPVWSETENMTIQHLMRDPNTAHMEDCIDQAVLEASLKVPVLFYTTYEKYLKNAKYWSQGRFAVQVDVRSEEQEREVLQLAEKYHAF